MSKSILVIDTPKGCIDCPFLSVDAIGNDICHCIKGDDSIIPYMEEKHPDCPLMTLAEFSSHIEIDKVDKWHEGLGTFVKEIRIND